MLELIAATTIISVALVPALSLMRGSLLNLEHLERNEQLVTLCTSKLETELALTEGTWDLSNTQGAIGGRFPDLLFRVSKSDATSEGGIPGELATIDVVVWYDADGGGDLDSGEPRARLSTKLAKVISYEYEATVH
ncbi:MAG: hypothetical protein Aurels2KO_37630 [Aureliella sp.]